MPNETEENPFGLNVYPTGDDWRKFHERQTGHFRHTPLPDAELIDHLTLYCSHMSMRRFLFWDRMYQQIISLQGVGMVFGVRWGRDLATLQHLRTIYEPMNYTRKFIGFDTFEGFPSVHKNDGNADIVRTGAYNVSPRYEEHLYRLLLEREAMLPYNQVTKFELRKGDAMQTVKAYLEEHPETVVAFAYFDFDLYEPTRVCAELIKPYLCKGAVIGFDEYMHPVVPGETKAVREVFGPHAKVQRAPQVSPGHPGFLIFEG